MDPAELLDILGNENRRKIIQLLANRPCYVSEISGRLGVGPKAVISHLSLLEKAGLIQCSVDEQRRKYFNIANNMRLEVSVSPYSYAVTLYDIAMEKDREEEEELLNEVKSRDTEASSIFLQMNRKLKELITQHAELARMQQDLQAEYTELMDTCMDFIEANAKDSVQCEILFELLKNEMTTASLCYNLRLPPNIISANLVDLVERGFLECTIKNNQQYWKICEMGVENK